MSQADRPAKHRTASSTDDVLEALRGLSMLDGLTGEDIRKLAATAELWSCPAGTILFGEGEEHAWLYFVCSGTVALDMTTAKCGRQRILTVSSGELLAWSALLGNAVMTSTAHVMEDSELLVFDAGQLQALLQEDHDLGYTVMHRVAVAMSRRLLATRLQLLDMYRV